MHRVQPNLPSARRTVTFQKKTYFGALPTIELIQIAQAVCLLPDRELCMNYYTRQGLNQFQGTDVSIHNRTPSQVCSCRVTWHVCARVRSNTAAQLILAACVTFIANLLASVEASLELMLLPSPVLRRRDRPSSLSSSPS